MGKFPVLPSFIFDTHNLEVEQIMERICFCSMAGVFIPTNRILQAKTGLFFSFNLRNGCRKKKTVHNPYNMNGASEHVSGLCSQNWQAPNKPISVNKQPFLCK